jgi:hypothetical protein
MLHSLETSLIAALLQRAHEMQTGKDGSSAALLTAQS